MMDYKNTREIADKVLGIVQTFPNDAIEKFVIARDTGIKITKYNIEEIVGVSGNRIAPLVRLVLDTSLDQSTVNSMFVTALAAKSKYEQSANEIEIVWTGPNEIDVGVRNTKQVIEEMLKSANRGEKVTIIDYMVTHKAENIVNELNSCLKDGVKVELIVDKNNANRRELRKCFSENSLVRPKIYTRREKESKYYKVHAKVIIVGEREMLVSSANLTELGTEVNFELGLLIRGPIVQQMNVLIKKMIDDEYFTEDETL